jgi:hypothetical protein
MSVFAAKCRLQTTNSRIVPASLRLQQPSWNVKCKDGANKARTDVEELEEWEWCHLDFFSVFS